MSLRTVAIFLLCGLGGCASPGPVFLSGTKALPAQKQTVFAIEKRDPHLSSRFMSVVDDEGKTLWNYSDASGAVKTLVVAPGRYKVRVMVFYPKDERHLLKSQPVVIVDAKAGGQYLFDSYFSSSGKAVGVSVHHSDHSLLATK
ncbi:hypothetical protein [Gallaecimonas mangrovi]|uniref:hypothetical protein n=1 Tax=Gallaecimonas mangrovi TaxID=2291597 RepID=UPI000E201FA0|nr:hypothetical protein [Gallaecimonas mangrovi]